MADIFFDVGNDKGTDYGDGDDDDDVDGGVSLAHPRRPGGPEGISGGRAVELTNGGDHAECIALQCNPGIMLCTKTSALICHEFIALR